MRYIIRLRKDWSSRKESLKKQFVSLTDEDLRIGEGNADELLEKLQQKLGKTRQEVITILNKL